MKFKNLINLSHLEFEQNGDNCYPQVWSLIYFLFNRYPQGLRTYLENYRNKKIDIFIDTAQGTFRPKDTETHAKLFEEAIGISMDKLESEWRKYVEQLN